METVKTLVSVFDQMLGHFVIGHWLAMSGPADVAVHREDQECLDAGRVLSGVTGCDTMRCPDLHDVGSVTPLVLGLPNCTYIP